MNTETKEFTQDGITVVFYKQPYDEKYSFLIKDNPALTAQLLANCANKRVKEDDLKFAVKGIFEKLSQKKFNLKAPNPAGNPIVILGERCQKLWGESMITTILEKTGPDHAPMITVQIELPDGSIYQASALNQKVAKQLAAEKALNDL